VDRQACFQYIPLKIIHNTVLGAPRIFLVLIVAFQMSFNNKITIDLGFPITCRAPSNTIMVGAKGITAASDIQTLASTCISKNYRGIMVWYGSVSNGFQYEASWDTSKDAASQNAFASALASFKSASG
jgi:hypothetical protein